MAIKYHSNIRLMDNNILQIGTGGDLKLEHTGTHSNIYNTTGNLNFINYADDQDISFQSDDGSGGVATYFKLDGSIAGGDGAGTLFTIWPDNSKIALGDNADLRMSHNGTSSTINNLVGDLIIKNGADDKGIYLQSDDGSGGTTTYILLHGALKTTYFQENGLFTDDKRLYFGSGADLAIYHDGTNSYIDAADGDTGYLYIRNTKTDGDINFVSDNGAGGEATYFFLDGSLATHDGSATTGLVTTWPDKSHITLGSSRDLRIYHDGSNSYLDQNGTGALYIRQTIDDQDIIFECDDGSGGNTAYITLDGSQTQTIFRQNAQFQDNVRGKFGAGGDLHIYHDGSNSLISQQVTGDLYIENTVNDGDIVFRSDDGSGGNATYLTIDGSAETVNFSKNIDVSGQNTDILMGDNLGAALEFKEGSNLYMRFITTNGSEAITLEKATTISNSLAVNSLGVNNGALSISGDNANHVTLTESGSGDFTIDAPDDIRLDAGGGDIVLKDDGTEFGRLSNSSTDFVISASTQDKDILFKGDDGGSAITALTLDMSDGGWATFNSGIHVANTFSPSTFGKATFAGNIGLGGATSPSRLLHIDNTSSAATASAYFYTNAQHTGSTTQAHVSIYSDHASSTGQTLFVRGDGTGDLLVLNKGGTNKLVVDDDGNATFASNVTVSGDLTVSGTTTTVNQTNLDVADNIIGLNRGSASNTNDSGIIIERGDVGNNAALIWDEGDDHFVLGTTASDASSTGGSIVVAGGNLKLGGLLLDGKSITGIDNQENFTNADDHIMTSAAIEDKILGYSYTANALPLAGGTMTGNLTFNNPVRELKWEHTSGQSSSRSWSFIGEQGIYGRFELRRSDAADNTPDTTVLRFDQSDATFAGDVTAGDDVNIGGDQLTFTNDAASAYIRGADALFIESDFDDDDGSSKPIYFYTNGTEMARMEATVATFAGDITVGDDLFMSNGGVINFNNGNVTLTHTSGALTLADSDSFRVGTGGDLRMYHDGSNSYIAQDGTGDLYIQQNTADKDLVLQSDDGSGGTTAYITLDGSAGYTTVQKQMNFGDGVVLALGASLDLQLFHESDNSFMSNYIGDLTIRNFADDKDIIFQSDDGSSGTATYFRLDGSEVETRFHKATLHYDNVKAKYGDSGDLELYHDGTGSYIVNGLGDLEITNNANNSDIIFKSDDGAGNNTIYFSVDGGAAEHDGSATTALYTIWPDKSRIAVGTSKDLQLDHNGTDSVIRNETGDLYLLQKADDKDIILSGDDNSGGTTEYIRIDGSSAKVLVSRPSIFYDTIEMASYIYHNGDTNTYFGFSGADTYTLVTGGTTALTVNSSQAATFAGDVQAAGLYVGSTNTSFDFYNNGTSYLNGQINVPDSVELRFGDGEDFAFQHNGTHNLIKSHTGDLKLINYQDDGDILFFSDDMSGGVAEYFRLDGELGYMVASKHILLDDSVRLRVGSSADLEIQHDGSHSYISQGGTGTLHIMTTTNDGDISFVSDNMSGGTAEYFRLDGGEGRLVHSVNSRYLDNVVAMFGAGADLQILSDGNDGFINNETNHLYITNNANDCDLILRSDDGSGGVTPYITLDGSEAITQFDKNIKLPDSVRVVMGTDSDFQIFHDGSHGYIHNTAGTLEIRNYTTDGDITLMSDDGSGGETAYMTIDGSNTRIFVEQHMQFGDNKKIRLGSGADLELYHDGTNSALLNATGDLYIMNSANDKDIIFQSDDGSGGAETYFFLDGSANSSDPLTIFPDNSYLAIGSGTDLYFNHNGTNSFIQNATGNLIINQRTNDGDLILQCDDGSGGETAYLTLDGSSGYTKAHKHILYEDNAKAMFGTSGDMQILHDGSNSYISQNVTGELYIENNATDGDVIFRSDDGSGGTTEYFKLDGSQATHDGSATTALATVFPDNSKIHLGSGSDGRLWHDGSHTYLQNTTGDLIIQNFADDKDVIFKSDNGSGGTATYFFLDGSATQTTFQLNTRHNDSVEAKFGDSGDFIIKHTGDTYLSNTSGSMNFRQQVTDGDMVFQCDDGSGGDATYFTLDGSQKDVDFSVPVNFGASGGSAGHDVTFFGATSGRDMFWDTTQDALRFDDNAYIYVGSSNDLQLYHDASHSHIVNLTGNLRIRNFADDSDITFESDDGSGGTQTYLTIDGSADRTVFSRSSRHSDNVVAGFGTGEDLQIYHDATNSYMVNGTGNLYIRNGANDSDIIFQSDDGSGGTTTYFFLDGSQANTNFQKDVIFADSKKALFGGSGDLQIYHDGSNSYIVDAGTGDLLNYYSNDWKVTKYGTGELSIWATSDAGVKLYYDNSLKLETVAAGVKTTYSATSNTDGDAAGDIVHLGETTTVAGKIYYYKSDGAWGLVDADAASTCSGLLAVALGTSSNTHGMLLRGMATIANDPGAVGDTLFASTTAGQATATAPSGSGDIVRVIGYCLDASNGQIWFNPDGAFVEVA